MTLLRNLIEEELDYLVLALRGGLHEDKVDVFFSVKKESEGVFNSSLDRIKEIISRKR